MIGCLVLAFALCQPGYYGGGGYYAQPVYYQQPVVYQQPVYYQPQPVYVQAQPMYYAQPYYGGGGPSINLNFGGGGRGYYNQGPRHYRR
jgi:hypothetical protein